MPFYQVEHCIPLEKSQRDSLAQAITLIHTRKFATPSLFVNVRFTDSNQDINYVAGKQCDINRVVAYVRAGNTRSKEDFDDVAQQILEAWNRIINPENKRQTQQELKRVLVMGAITTGVESGFLLPSAGRDATWLKENRPKFEELAEHGETEFIELMQEIRTRQDLLAL